MLCLSDGPLTLQITWWTYDVKIFYSWCELCVKGHNTCLRCYLPLWPQGEWDFHHMLRQIQGMRDEELLANLLQVTGQTLSLDLMCVMANREHILTCSSSSRMRPTMTMLMSPPMVPSLNRVDTCEVRDAAHYSSAQQWEGISAISFVVHINESIYMDTVHVMWSGLFKHFIFYLFSDLVHSV